MRIEALLIVALALPATSWAAGQSLVAVAPKPARALVLPELKTQRQVDLRDFRGRVVLLNFWASWCPPCREEMPSMQRLADKMKGRPFAVVAVDVNETDTEIAAFLQQVPVDFTILMDREGSLVRQWKIFAFPSSYLVDHQGVVRYTIAGALEWDGAEALEKIESLLSQVPR